MAYILGIIDTTKIYRLSCDLTPLSGTGLFSLSCGAGSFEKL
jgi:hypothetical protein